MPPTDESSLKLSLTCSVILALLMIILRPVFRLSPETTFLGGFFGAILFFFILIMFGNLRGSKGDNTLGWGFIIISEILALIVSFVIHPVCITTCFLFSIPVIIYIKWAATKIRNSSSVARTQNKKK